ncbi:hypothetical protein [uncultured Methanobacterium sp.]|uniref:hypothetical protein n=1 Tax=uncultured Methanobacterium sp. TaxID=176306 RepID=UPI002AA7F994|nr:hypothetical protein [uncultured Methanobacterium sp.]
MESFNPEVFVMMPFADEFKSGYEDIIEPAVRKVNMSHIRADKDPQGNILTMMFDRIFNSQILISDISDNNPNVFYELGLAHNLGKKTIIIVREGSIEKIPFDIASYRILFYPERPTEESKIQKYQENINEIIGNLAEELEKFKDDNYDGINNPIQEYMSKKSPLTSNESSYLDNFTASLEDAMFQTANDEIVYIGISGSDFVRILEDNSANRKKPLKIKVFLLDINDNDGWNYLHLLTGHNKKKDLNTFKIHQEIKQDELKDTLNDLPETLYSYEINSYNGIPIFWAYMIDKERIIFGHLAINKIKSRNLPVSVLVKDDPKTQALFKYYSSVISSVMKND